MMVCANCGIRIEEGAAYIEAGKPYCCRGCAQGGPCCCEYFPPQPAARLKADPAAQREQA